MLQVVSSKFTIFYILNRTLLLLIPIAFVLAPFYVIFFENKSRYDTVVMPIVILSIFVGIFVYVFLKAYSLIRIEIYPHAIRFNNLIKMKGLQYKYADIEKLQVVSQVTVGVQGRKGGWYGYTLISIQTRDLSSISKMIFKLKLLRRHTQILKKCWIVSVR